MTVMPKMATQKISAGPNSRAILDRGREEEQGQKSRETSEGARDGGQLQCALGLAALGHGVAVKARDHVGRLSRHIHEDGVDASPVDGGAVDRAQEDEPFGGREGEGDRDSEGYTGRRIDAGQCSHHDSDHNVPRRIRKRTRKVSTPSSASSISSIVRIRISFFIGRV